MKKRASVIASFVLMVMLVLSLNASAYNKLYDDDFSWQSSSCGPWNEGDGYVPTSCGTGTFDDAEWRRMTIDFTTGYYGAYIDVYVDAEYCGDGCVWQIAARTDENDWHWCNAIYEPASGLHECSWDGGDSPVTYERLQIRYYEGYLMQQMDVYNLDVEERYKRPIP